MLRHSSTVRCALIVTSLLIAPSALLAQLTAPLYWDAATSNGFLWGDVSNWSTTAGGINNPAGVPVDPANDAIFNGTGINGATIVQLGAAQSALGLDFNNTGTTLIDSSNSTAQILTIGGDGITVDSAAGAVTLGDATNAMPISLSSGIAGNVATWTNNSTANTLTIANGVSAATTSFNLTIAGAGNTTFNGLVTDGAGPLAITQNGTGTITFNAANTNTGALTINSGTVTFHGASGWTTGTGLTLGGPSATGNAVLNINTSGSVTETGATTIIGGGTSGVGVINQSSGTFIPGSTGSMSLGLPTSGNAAYGAYNFAGGTLTTGGTSGIVVGGGGLGVYTQSAGALTCNGSFAIESSNPGGMGVATFTGGTVSVVSAAKFLINANVTGVGTGVLNVGTEAGGNAVLTSLNTTTTAVLITGATNAAVGNTGILNLNSGTLKLSGSIAKGGSTTATAIVNLNGGTLQVGANFDTPIGKTLNSVNIYKGGVIIDTQSFTAASISASLLAAAGNGIYPAGGTLALADGSGGTGYVGAPVVTVNGGSGFAASAIANISGGTITGVTLTCPGQNYLAGDMLSFTFSGGGASSAANPFVYTLQPADLAANNTGTVTKNGSTPLTLSGTASTFSGGLIINNGILSNGASMVPTELGSGNVTFGPANTPTLNLGGSSATIGLLSGGINGVVTNMSNGGPTLTLNGTGSQSFAGIIQQGGTGMTVALTLSGGTQTLSGADTYTGATKVNGGTLRLGTGGSLGNTAISVNTGATFNPVASTSAGTTTAGTAGATLALGNGAIFSTNDNAIGTFTLKQNVSFASPALNLNGATLNMDIGPSGTDTLAVVQGAGGGVASVLGENTINLTAVGSSLTLGTYNLITAASGVTGTFQFSNSTTTQTVTAGNTTYTVNLVNSDAAEQLVVTGGVFIPATTYWKGSLSGGNTGVWTAGGATAATNWTSDAAGTTDALQIPGSTTNVLFTADSAGNFANTTLGADLSINSLTFSGTGSAASANGNPAGNGITVESGSGAHTISCNVALGGSQTWTNNSANTLTVSGNISDGGNNYSLTIAGTGSFLFSGSNSYGGITTVSGGTLRTTGFGALGTGPLAVNSAGTATPLVDVGSNEAVGALTGSVSGSGSATVRVEAGKSLGVAPTSGTSSFAGTLNLVAGTATPGTGGALSKSGNGTEVLSRTVQLNNGTTLKVSGGSLSLNASGGTIGTGVTANVSGTGTLELAGSYSALGTTTPDNRAAISNMSTATAGVLVTSGNQLVGGIDGSGNVQVMPTGQSDSLTADHIRAGSLVIGGDATSSAVVTIAASDPDGMPLAQSSGFALAGSLAAADSFAGGALSSASLLAADGSSGSGQSLGGSSLGTVNVGGSIAAVPEPSSIVLLMLGSLAIPVFVAQRRASRSQALPWNAQPTRLRLVVIARPTKN